MLLAKACGTAPLARAENDPGHGIPDTPGVGKLPGLAQASSATTNSRIMTKPIRITSYRLAYWHAPQRACHEEGDVFTCIFCQYSEGIARMKDVVAHLCQHGFPITAHDARSFLLEVEKKESATGSRQQSAVAVLSAYVSGRSSRIPA